MIKPLSNEQLDEFLDKRNKEGQKVFMQMKEAFSTNDAWSFAINFGLATHNALLAELIKRLPIPPS